MAEGSGDQPVARAGDNAQGLATTLLFLSETLLRPHHKVALVTGAAGAIGSAICHRLAQAGSAVVLCDIAEEPLSRLAAEIERDHGLPAVAIRADLSRTEAPSEIMQMIELQLGGIDHLVNNAGLNLAQTIHDAVPSDWDRVFAVNLRAPMLLCQAAVASWSRRGGGGVVNIGSRVWLSGSVPAYTASKAGLVGLTRSLAVELAGMNVTANVVAPSFVDTAFTRGNRNAEELAVIHERVREITPIPRLGLADDVANAVAFLLSDQAGFITGEVLHVCGGAQLAARSTNASPQPLWGGQGIEGPNSEGHEA